MYRTLFALFSSLAAPVAAGDFALNWPIDCVLGDSCHIQQYVDRDPGPSGEIDHHVWATTIGKRDLHLEVDVFLHASELDDVL